VIAFFHFLLVKPNKMYGMKQAFFRTNAANLCNLFGTLIVALIIVYVQVSLY
jgi:protein transport protein SEC61 subunit alpha